MALSKSGGDDDRWGLIARKPSGSGYKSIDANIFNAVAVKADGTLVVWGYNVPDIYNYPKDGGYVTAVLGGGFGTAIKEDGSLVSWGDDSSFRVSGTPTGTGFKAVAAGGRHAVAIKADGSLVSWGDNSYGQVSGTPTGTGFSAIACGDFHTLALRSDGSITSWGNRLVYGANDVPSGNDFIAISAGQINNAAIRRNNHAPVAFAGDDFTVQVHDGNPIFSTFHLAGLAWDEDNDPLTYTWTDENGTVLVTGHTGAYNRAIAELWKPIIGTGADWDQTDKTGKHTYTLTVTDQFGQSSSDQVTVTVLPDPNQAPVVYMEMWPTKPLPIVHDGNPQTGADIWFDCNEYDDEGDPLTIAWRDETGKLLGTSSTLLLKNVTGDRRTISVTLTDPYGASATDSLTFVVEENASPTLSVPSSMQVNIGCPVTFNATATDPDAVDILTYSLFGSPAWATINSATGQITLAPPAGTVGDFTLQVKVTDPYGATDTKSVTVSVCPILIENVSASRKNGIVTVQFNVRNTDGTIVNNISLNRATLQGINTMTALPIVFPQMKQGVVKTVQVKFCGVGSGPATFLVNGTSSAGPVNANLTINMP